MNPTIIQMHLDHVKHAQSAIDLVAAQLDEFATLASNEPEYSREVINGSTLERLANTLLAAHDSAQASIELLEREVGEGVA